MGEPHVRASRRWLNGMWLLLAAAPALAQAPVAGIYSCVDGKGRMLTSDRPIAECVDREQKVLNPSGTVRAKLGPTLTAQERADIAAKERLENEARTQQAEDRRRERALLTRYPSRAAHDRERVQAFDQVAAVAQAAQKRVEELLKDLGRVNQEMEFYKKDPSKAPYAIRRQVDDIAQGVAVQRRFIAEQELELKRVSAHFDDELLRLKPLWEAQSATRSPSPTARKAP